MSLVIAELRDDVGTIIMDHRKKLNVLSEALIEEIINALTEFRVNKARAVVLRGRREEAWTPETGPYHPISKCIAFSGRWRYRLRIA